MFLLPGYVNWYEKDGTILLTSELKQTTIELFNKDIKDEFYAIVQKGGTSTLSSPLTIFLRENNLLLNREEINKELDPIFKILDESLLLTIMPTEGCNFRCTYCYENHEPVTMSDKTISQIVSFITDAARNYRCILVNWFGGEPTLCMDAVLKISETIKKLQRMYPFQYVANMTTNGYLLNEGRFQQLFNAGISGFQITLDGWNHDETRPHFTGKGTLSVIVEQLKSIARLPKERFSFRIILRHNILSGDEDYSWYDYLYDLFGSDDRFSVLVRPVGNWGGDCVSALSILHKGDAEELLGKHIQYLKKIGMSCENGRNDLLCKTCYACYPHSMVFRSNGRIERCTVALDHPNNMMGNVGVENKLEVDTAAESRWRFSGLNNNCYTCNRLLSCFNMSCKKNSVINGADSSNCPIEFSNVY